MIEARHRIADWWFDPREPMLRGEAGERRLEDRAARVLSVLCKRRGDVVSKAELIATVWGGRSVSANSVSIVIGSLRRALGDDPDHPALLVTVARRGYRLEVEPETPGATVKPAPSESSAGRALVFTGLLAGLAVVVLGSSLALHRVEPAVGVPVLVNAPQNTTGRSTLDGLTASLAPVIVHGVGRLHGVRILDGARAGVPRIVVSARLILWNGAPEVALSATDTTTHSIVWSDFAAGPPALLARHVEDRLASLGAKLPPERRI